MPGHVLHVNQVRPGVQCQGDRGVPQGVRVHQLQVRSPSIPSDPREASTDRVPEHPHHPTEGPEPDEVLALARALRALPPRMRATVVCRYWWQLSVEETATALGCSTGTVKSQTSRALDKLRADLKPDPVLHDDHHPAPSPSTLGGHHG